MERMDEAELAQVEQLLRKVKKSSLPPNPYAAQVLGDRAPGNPSRIVTDVSAPRLFGVMAHGDGVPSVAPHPIQRPRLRSDQRNDDSASSTRWERGCRL